MSINLDPAAYPVSPSELFILLGRDGEDLLNVAEQYRLRISVDREKPGKSQEHRSSELNDATSPPPTFVLRASGVRQDHKLFKKHLEDQKKVSNTNPFIRLLRAKGSWSKFTGSCRSNGCFTDRAATFAISPPEYLKARRGLCRKRRP